MNPNKLYKSESDLDFKETLNDEQKVVFDALNDFIKEKESNTMFCLRGYAGTGKTYTITQFIRHYLVQYKFKKVVLSAPTNKAVQVLKEASSKSIKGSRWVSFNTIHQVLGIKPDVTDDGREVFGIKQKKDNLELDLLVIDEVSMLNDDLFFELIKYQSDIKIVFMGDPAQIPQVNKVDCEPFLNPEKYNIVTHTLTKIMRQADGSSLVDLSFNIREKLDVWHPSHIEDKDGFDLKIWKNNSLDSKDNLRTHLNDFFSSEEFKSNTSEYKVIAWRNDRVAFYNKFIREVYHGKSDLPQYLVNDMIITNNPVFDEDDIILNTNQELKLLEVIDKDFLVNKKKIKGYELKCKYFDSDADKDIEISIRALKEDYIYEFNAICNKIAKQAKNTIESTSRKKMWRYFFKTKKYFADIGYSFAITAHKSQGSTYLKTFVDMNDICANQNIVERNRIAYTSITRAKKYCTIITN